MVMIRSRIARLIGAVTLTLVATLGLGRPSIAASSTVYDLPAGLACSFALRVEVVGGNQVQKTFVDKNGTVRTISAGKGSALTFTNTETGSTLSLKPNGSVTFTTTPNADGSTTYVVVGHNVLIFFPTDVPAGPSTTLYIGRVVFTVDSAGVFTLQEVSGKSTDICAILS
jgi:hypothetical protein